MMITLPATAHFVVSYDDSLTGNANQWSGKQLARNVLDYCEYDYARLSALFGGEALQPANLPIAVNIVASSGGGGSNDALAAIPGNFPPTITLNVGPNNVYFTRRASAGFSSLRKLKCLWSFRIKAGIPCGAVSGQILYPQTAWTSATGSSWFNTNTHNNPPDCGNRGKDQLPLSSGLEPRHRSSAERNRQRVLGRPTLWRKPRTFLVLQVMHPSSRYCKATSPAATFTPLQIAFRSSVRRTVEASPSRSHCPV